MFAQRYPELRDRLIGEIKSWEAASQDRFLYRGRLEVAVAVPVAAVDYKYLPNKEHWTTKT